MSSLRWSRTILTLLTTTAALATGCVDLSDDGTDPSPLSACPNMGSEGSTFYEPAASEPRAAPAKAHRDVVARRAIADGLPALHADDSAASVLGLQQDVATLGGWAPIGGGEAGTDVGADGEDVTPVPDEDTDPAATGGQGGQAADPGSAAGQGDAPAQTPDPADTPAGDDVPATEPGPSAPLPDPIFSQPYDPSVDPLQMFSASQIDLSKDFMPTYGFPMPAFDNFLANGLQPGQKMPEIALWNLDGKLVKLSQYKDKSNVAIILGSASCMVFRRHSLALWTKLHQRAADATAKTGKKLEILVIYTQEAHPALENSIYAPQKQWTGEENVADKVLVSMTKTFAERVMLARGLDARFPFNRANVWIDGQDNAVWTMLGEVPNAMFLVDSQGTLVWKELWAMHAGTDWNYGETWPAPDAKPTAFAMIDKLLGL